jgi:hypothetical protein
MKATLFSRITIIFALTCITLSTIYISKLLYDNSVRDKALKADYFIINQIKYGLLSGSNWSMQVNRIIVQQVDSFQFSSENKKVLKEQISTVLSRLFDEVDEVLHKKRNGKEKIRFKVLNALVDVDAFKKEIPRFSEAIIDEMDKSKNKDKVKEILKEKVTTILNTTDQDVIGERQYILNKYSPSRVEDVNLFIAKRTGEIREEQKKLGYVLIGLMVITLLLWAFIIKMQLLYATAFLFSVLISFVTLFIGVNLPMIEIDARLATLDLKLLSSHIIFKDQVIFFQTKSIFDVVKILITQGKSDSVFVGCLIFLFSVLFPVTKLICASIFISAKTRTNGFVYYMAFKSGKWSMADVMVVAIFMAFVGFRGILNNQMEDMNMHNDMANLVSTNKTSLQTGFIIFVSFVLFNLGLAEVLKIITRNKRPGEEKAKA